MPSGSLPPSVRFARLAGFSLVAGALLVGGVSTFLIQRFHLQDTLEQTRQAVERHLLDLFPKDVFRRGLGPEALASFDRVVRAHFDLYGIRHAVFYDPRGRVVFSYDRDAIAAPVGAGPADGRGQAAGEHSQHLEQGAYGEHPPAGGGEAGPSASSGGANAGPGRYPPPLRPETVQALAPAGVAEQVVFTDPGTGRRIRALRAALPLSESGRPLGAVEVYRDLEPMFAQIRVIQAGVVGLLLAGVALLYVSLRRVFHAAASQLRRQSDQLRAAFDEVRETYETTLAVLTSALDQRDYATQGHSVRVVAYTRALAARLGVSGPELEHLLRGALLHDIGKIGVSDAILRKASRLTPEEWREMRRHPEIGYQMLAPVPFLSGALPVILYHHERWDGSGYPVGLQGREIPRSARIFAVADVFDAMTSNRPYRGALPYEEARDHLVAERGRLYDPDVVDAFLEVPEAEWRSLAEAAAAPQRNPGDLRSALGLRGGQDAKPDPRDVAGTWEAAVARNEIS